MDQIKTGMIIRQLRTEHHLTQAQLADKIHVSDKAVSKWERGSGCPDISLLTALAEVFDTDVRVLLSGEIHRKESEKGNMKKMKFYICSHCGNIITATSDAEITCCGSLLSASEPRKAEESEQLMLSEVDGESIQSRLEEYYAKAGEYMEKGVLLISTWEGELKVNNLR